MGAARIGVLIAAVAAALIAAFLVRSMVAPDEASLPPSASAQMLTVDVLVAAESIEIGDILDEETLEWQTWPENSVSSSFITRSDRPDAISQFSGSVSRAALVDGEPVIEEKLHRSPAAGFLASLLPSGMRAMSIPVTPETAVSGFVLPGDRVDIVLSRAVPTTGADTYYAETILTNVGVLAIDDNVSENNEERTILGQVATLGVSAQQAELLAVAVRLGTLTLVLRSASEQSSNDPEFSCLGINGIRSVNVIRYGQVRTEIIGSGGCG